MSRRSRKRILRRLRRAMKHHTYLRLVRRFEGADRIAGHTVAIGRRWLVLAVADEGSPDGFVALRIRDLRRLEWAAGGDFIRESLEAGAAWPPEAPRWPVDLDHGVRKLVTSVATAAPLVSIHPERADVDVCYTGYPLRWKSGQLHLHEVSLEGRWERASDKHRVRDITRVDFGRVYENNLAVVAGPRPPMSR